LAKEKKGDGFMIRNKARLGLGGAMAKGECAYVYVYSVCLEFRII